jgi:hypothetical protein
VTADLERTTDDPVAHFAETKELADQARRNLAYATPDSPPEEAGFELVVPDFRETFLLYRFRAANWPGATPGSETDNGSFTMGRARLAPAMMPTPGHQASRRRDSSSHAREAWLRSLRWPLGSAPALRSSRNDQSPG